MFSRFSQAPSALLASFLGVCAGTAMAADMAVDTATVSLDEVIVSANKGSSSLRDTPAAVSKIGQAVLAEKKPLLRDKCSTKPLACMSPIWAMNSTI